VAAGGLAAEGIACGQHFGHHRLFGGRRQAQVDEPGAGNLQRLDPALHGSLALQQVHQPGGQFTRVLLQRPRQLHGAGDGQVAMAGLLGGLESGDGHGRTRLLRQLRQRHLQRLPQLLLCLDHRTILLLRLRRSR